MSISKLMWVDRLNRNKENLMEQYTEKGAAGMARPRKAEGEKYIRQDISMEPGQFRRLMAYCQREDRSISWVIRKALEMFLVCSDT